jgi:hypothetical protein
MFPLAVWFYLNADYLGVSLAILVGLVVLASTVTKLFGRQEP